MIKKYYFINKFETNNIDKQDKETIIIYRNYSAKKYDENQNKNRIFELPKAENSFSSVNLFSSIMICFELS